MANTSQVKFVLTHPNGWGGAQQWWLHAAAVLAKLVLNTVEGNLRLTFMTESEASLHGCLTGPTGLSNLKVSIGTSGCSGCSMEFYGRKEMHSVLLMLGEEH